MKISFFRRWRCVLAYFAVLGAAVLLWAAYQALPCPVTAVLAPVNDSPWEVSKSLFWPTLAAVVILRHWAPPGEERGGECVLLLLLPLVTMAGRALLPRISPAVLCAVIPAAGLAFYALVFRRRMWGGALIWYALASLLGIAYLLLTALPPRGVLFGSADTAVMNTIPF